jgi:hypothetical protein
MHRPASRRSTSAARRLTRPPEPIAWDEATAKPVDVPPVEDDQASVIAH